ncbi:MAG: HAD hydrolase family protein [Pyrinomonadaceae bacterium]|nr:HAD hydrolase family protein [Pyrinomonadaceae bacterium]
MNDLSSIERRAARIRLLLMDCDGVLTDGRLWLLGDGDEQKSFNVRDGLGLELWHRAGFKSGVISGRNSSALERRAHGLRIEYVRQGSENKIKDFEELLGLAEVDENEVAFVGDDLNDIPLMLRSKLAVAVADAVEETRAVAHLVTQATGGSGAVREVVEVILKAQGRWEEVTEKYLKAVGSPQ